MSKYEIAKKIVENFENNSKFTGHRPKGFTQTHKQNHVCYKSMFSRQNRPRT